MIRVALLMTLCLCGCSGSLTQAHTDGLAARRGATVGVAPSARCQSIDNQRTTWGAVEVGGVVLTSASGIGTLALPGDSRDVQRALAGATLGAAVVTAVAFEVEQAKDTAWVRECQ